MDYANSHPAPSPTPLRLTSIVITSLAFLTGLICLQVALSDQAPDGIGTGITLLLLAGLVGLLFACK